MRKKVFQEFDEFATSILDVDSRMLFRNAEKRVWTLEQIQFSRADIQLGLLGSGNIAQGRMRSNGLIIYQPLTSGIEYVANGTTVKNGSLVVLPPGSEFCIRTDHAHDWSAVFLPLDLFGEDSQIENRATRESASCWVTEPAPSLSAEFQFITQQMLNCGRATSEFETSPAARLAQAELFELSHRVLGGGRSSADPQNGRPRLPRRIVFERAMAFVEEQQGEPFSIRRLSGHAGVSERTLRNVFHEYVGISPTQYFILKRLHRVRRVLKDADPNCMTVSDVLVREGEWQFSRFASRYKRFFGELPSETLHSS